MGFTFSAVTIAWVFFRADSITDTIIFFKQSSLNVVSWPTGTKTDILALAHILLLVTAEIIIFKKIKLPKQLRAAVYVFGLTLILRNLGNAAGFIYFQF